MGRGRVRRGLVTRRSSNSRGQGFIPFVAEILGALVQMWNVIWLVLGW